MQWAPCAFTACAKCLLVKRSRKSSDLTHWSNGASATRRATSLAARTFSGPKPPCASMPKKRRISLSWRKTKRRKTKRRKSTPSCAAIVASRTSSKVLVRNARARSCGAGKASQRQGWKDKPGLQLAHVAAGEVEEVRLVLDGGGSTVVLEELLDLVRESQTKTQRNALSKPASSCWHSSSLSGSTWNRTSRASASKLRAMEALLANTMTFANSAS